LAADWEERKAEALSAPYANEHARMNNPVQIPRIDTQRGYEVHLR
jgi:hypothetical protein